MADHVESDQDDNAEDEEENATEEQNDKEQDTDSDEEQTEDNQADQEQDDDDEEQDGDEEQTEVQDGADEQNEQDNKEQDNKDDVDKTKSANKDHDLDKKANKSESTGMVFLNNVKKVDDVIPRKNKVKSSESVKVKSDSTNEVKSSESVEVKSSESVKVKSDSTKEVKSDKDVEVKSSESVEDQRVAQINTLVDNLYTSADIKNNNLCMNKLHSQLLVREFILDKFTHKLHDKKINCIVSIIGNSLFGNSLFGKRNELDFINVSGMIGAMLADRLKVKHEYIMTYVSKTIPDDFVSHNKEGYYINHNLNKNATVTIKLSNDVISKNDKVVLVCGHPTNDVNDQFNDMNCYDSVISLAGGRLTHILSATNNTYIHNDDRTEVLMHMKRENGKLIVNYNPSF